MPLGSQHGPQNPPKTVPTSTQNRLKIDVKIDENFDCILRWFLVALGANMAPKASQKPSKIGRVIPLVFGLGKVLGGSWGLLGPKSRNYRYLINFWSIFDRFFQCLVDFWSMFLKNHWEDLQPASENLHICWIAWFVTTRVQWNSKSRSCILRGCAHKCAQHCNKQW